MNLRKKIQTKEAHIGVIGLGYVGLPLVIEFCKALKRGIIQGCKSDRGCCLMTPRQPRVTADEIIKVLKSIGFDYMSALLHFTLCSLRYALCFYSPPPPFQTRNRYFLKRRWRKIAVNSKELTLCCLKVD